jgi:hypothetical protein
VAVMGMEEKFRNIALTKITASFREGQEELQSKISRILSEGTKHGTLNSTGTFQRAEAACVSEMKARVRNAWAIFREVMDGLRIENSPALADEVKSEIRTCLYPSQSEINQTLWGIPGRELMPLSSIKDLNWIQEQMLTEIGADIDLYTASPRPKRVRSRSKQNAIFLSHAAVDASIALLIKEELQRRIPGLIVFCSSDPSDLPPGSRWSPEIQRALEHSSVLVLIASEHSLKRPWVWFECGTFWFGSRRIIPLCLGKVRKGDLRPPMSELQAINGDDPTDLKILLEALSKASRLALSENEALEALATAIRRMDDENSATVNSIYEERGLPRMD